MEESLFHLPSVFNSVSQCLPPSSPPPFFLQHLLQYSPSAKTLVLEYSFSQQHCRRTSTSLVSPSPALFPLWSFIPIGFKDVLTYNYVWGGLQEDGLGPDREQDIGIYRRSLEQILKRILYWRQFRGLTVLVECFGCVHMQSHKSTFSRGLARVYLWSDRVENHPDCSRGS